MKKVCFIISHHGSGSFDLLNILNQNPRCDIHSSQYSYDNPQDLNWMFLKNHKCRDNSAVYGDHLLYNMSFSCKKLYNYCKFIYVIRPARASLNEMISMNYQQEYAARYYRYRLRRICEMAKKTPDSVLVTWEDLVKGYFSEIENMLNLKEKLYLKNHHFITQETNSFKESLVSECEDAYERYYYYLKNFKNE